MLNKCVSILIVFCLILTVNLVVFGQIKLDNKKNSKSIVFDNDSNKLKSERAKNLLNKDSYLKINEDSTSAMKLPDASQKPQKKKFVGMNKTAAIIIGVAAVAAIVIVLVVANSNNNDRNNDPFPCSQFPCN